VDKLGTKIAAKVIHKLHLRSSVLDTRFGGTEKRIRFKGLRSFSTEIGETITTSF
jgi:hypothetical protein